MKKLSIVFLLLSVFLFSQQKHIFTTAKINSVTVYKNNCEIHTSSTVNLPSGYSEIVVKNISEEIDDKTIRVGTDKNITLQSVSYTEDYLDKNADPKNSTIKRVNDSIKIITEFIEKANIDLTSTNKTLELLDKNQSVLVGSNNSNVAELIKLTDFYKNKRTELNVSVNTLNERIAKLTSQLKNLKNKLAIGESRSEEISKGKILLKIFTNNGGNTKLDIDYISTEAGWEPFYELKAMKVNEPLQLTYKAKIRQNTGIDWQNVKLTLVNGNPNQNHQAPTINPWFLNAYKQEERKNNNVAYKKDSVKTKNIEEVVMIGYGIRKINENQLNISFDIDEPYTVKSDDEDQMVTITRYNIPAVYKYYAVPKINQQTYLVADIADFAQYNLLQGNANVIFENYYVGETYINPNTTDERMRVTLGEDKKVYIKRVRVAEKTGSKFLSSSQEQVFTYDILVRNNKKELISIDLKDQIPISKNDNIEIELLESSGADLDKETGILSWNIKIASNETKKLRLSYKVRYPKDYIIN